VAAFQVVQDTGVLGSREYLRTRVSVVLNDLIPTVRSLTHHIQLIFRLVSNCLIMPHYCIMIIEAVFSIVYGENEA
jgi:hypothetical protein